MATDTIDSSNNVLLITPSFLDYGNTHNFDVSRGFYVVQPPTITTPTDYTMPGNTVPGVFWTTHSNTATTPPTVDIAGQFSTLCDRYPSDFIFTYNNAYMLEPAKTAVVHIPDAFNKCNYFSNDQISAHWKDEKEFLHMVERKNSYKFSNKLVITQHSFTMDVKSLVLPYTTFVCYNSWYMGSVTFINVGLDNNAANVIIPLVNNCCFDENYGNVVNQITVDENGNPTVTPTIMAFVDNKGRKSTSTNSIMNVVPQYDENGNVIRTLLPYNQPIDASGNSLNVTGYLVDVSKSGNYFV